MENKWVILDRSDDLACGKIWARCACGVEKRISKYHLRDGRTKSCGGCKVIVGNIYGILKALEVAEPEIRDGRKHKNRWLCECTECGARTTKTTTVVASKKGSCDSKTCRFKPVIAAQNRLYGTYKRSARDRGLSFDITYNLFIELTSSDCEYCGIKPATVQRGAKKNGDYLYNGLDRIDPKCGYTHDNVVPCCKYCNYGKFDRSPTEFKQWAQKLVSKPLWEPKCWGRVWHRLYDQHLHESLLEVEPGWCSSIHVHHHRYNCFVSKSATILIDIYATPETKAIETKILAPGQSTVVPPEIWHRFRVLERGSLVELYWSDVGNPCLTEDITRHNQGGRW